jgi:transmembrane sensor
MEKDFYIALLIKKWKGDISEAETIELAQWLSQKPENQQLADQTHKAWQTAEHYELPFDLDEEEGFNQVLGKIGIADTPPQYSEPKEAKIVTMPRRNYLQWWAAAASVTLLAVAGWWFLGKNIGVEKTLVADVAQKEVTLADGTKIWLNVGSKLTYPETFTAAERPVKLEGEAFFEVAKDAKRPFQIATNTTKVTVLGTAFNVRAFDNEPTVEVAVREGKVRFENNTGGGQKMELVAQERGIFDKQKDIIEKTKDENLNASAWQRKKLIFNNLQLFKIAKDVEDFYKIKVEISDIKMQNCSFTGRFDTQRKPEQLLNDIAQVLKMTLEKRAENDFILRGGTCQ